VREQPRKALLGMKVPSEPEPTRPCLSESPAGSWQGRQRLSVGSHFPTASASPTQGSASRTELGRVGLLGAGSGDRESRGAGGRAANQLGLHYESKRQGAYVAR